MGTEALFHLRIKSCYEFLSPLKTNHPLLGFEPANIGSNGKHNNHYTTENVYSGNTIEHKNTGCLMLPTLSKWQGQIKHIKFI
jgi:hypothetical protein